LSNHIDHEAIENLPHLKPYYDNKRLFFRNVCCIIVSNALYTFGFGATGSLIAMHMANAHLSASKISTIFAIAGWLAIPTLLYISNLTDKWQWKWGRRLPFIAISVPAIVVALLFFSRATSFLSCLGLYLLYSLASQVRGATYPFLNNDVSKKCYWGRISGVNDLLVGSVGGWLSIIILLPLVNMYSEKVAFGASALLVGVATVVLLLFIKEPPIRSTDGPERNPIKVIGNTLKFGFSDLRNMSVFIAYALCMNAGIFQTFIALQAKVNLQMNEGQVGTHILQYGLIATVLASFFIGWSVDKLGTVKSLILGYGGMVSAAALGFNPTVSSQFLSTWINIQISPVYALAGAYLIGLSSFCLMSTAAGIFVIASVPREQMARFCACSGSVNMFTQSFFMLLIGFLITNVFGGNYGCSFLATLVLGLAGVVMFYIVNRRYHHVAQHQVVNPAPDVVNVAEK